MAIAKETLEGNLRGVLATLTPEEVNQDKIKFAQSLLTEAEDDLRRLGLELDTLKIQDVSDDVDYLDSIGRKQSAEVQKNALIAEARAKAESAVRSASNRRETELSKIEAQIATARAENARRLADAQTRSGGAGRRGAGAGRVAAGARRGRAGGAEGAHRAGQAAAGRRRAGAGARAPRPPPRPNAKGAAAQIIEQGRATAVGDGRDRRHLARGRSERAQRLPDAEGRGSHAHRDEHRRDAEGRQADGPGRHRRRQRRRQRRRAAGLPDLTGKLIAASEQIKAATGIDIAAALRARTPPRPSLTAPRPR